MHTAFPTAGVRITVTNFVPTYKVPNDAQAADYRSFFTTATVKLISDADGLVTQAAEDAPLKVFPRAKVDFVFEVVNGRFATDGRTYNPVGIGFFGQNGGVGIDDFPARTVSGDVFNRLLLRVHDANVHSTSFKFSLLIQCEDTGELGVIDPQVANG